MTGTVVTSTTTNDVCKDVMLTPQSFNLSTLSPSKPNIPYCHLRSGVQLKLYFKTEKRLMKYWSCFQLQLNNTAAQDEVLKYKSYSHSEMPEELTSNTMNVADVAKRQANYTLRIVNVGNNQIWRYKPIIRPANFLFYCFNNRNVTVAKKERGATTLTLSWSIAESLGFYDLYHFVEVAGKKNQPVDYSKNCHRALHNITCKYTLHGLDKCREYNVSVKVTFRRDDDGVQFVSRSRFFKSKPNYEWCKPSPPEKPVLNTKQIIILTCITLLMIIIIVACVVFKRKRYKCPRVRWKHYLNITKLFETDYVQRIKPTGYIVDQHQQIEPIHLEPMYAEVAEVAEAAQQLLQKQKQHPGEKEEFFISNHDDSGYRGDCGNLADQKSNTSTNSTLLYD